MGEAIFELLKDPSSNRVPLSKLYSTIEETGIRLDDPRLSDLSRQILELERSIMNMDIPEKTLNAPINFNSLDLQTFQKCIGNNVSLLNRIVQHDFAIPEWSNLTSQLDTIYEECKTNTTGKVASYIPQLARVSPDIWGVSVCSVDGQRYSRGDSQEKFTLQAIQYPLAYALALNESSGEFVHKYVGFEPSGLPYTALALNNHKRPHNPMINSGAIVIASLLKNRESLADRFDYAALSEVLSHYGNMGGGEYVGFNNAIFLSERESSNRNFAIGYTLKEHKCFPEHVNFQEVMDLYFQLCSIELTCEAGAVIAATLANGGICPVTAEKLLSAEAVRDTLSLMHSCGMYDFSGQFAFRIGLPAKASVSGAIILVIPNVMGMCFLSPPLDSQGNSVRGLMFCQKLIDNYNFHNYDSLIHLQKKDDPRRRSYERKAHEIVSLLFSAKNNDITSLRRVFLRGVDMTQRDYDGRTALHIAAAEGHLEVVRFLIETAQVGPNVTDRWGFTPLTEAQRFNHLRVINYLEEVLKNYDDSVFTSK